MSEVTEQFEISPEFCEKYCYGRAWPLPRLRAASAATTNGTTRTGQRAPAAALSSSFQDKYDVVISGAGPAGLFLKLLLTRLGLENSSVLSVDPKPRATDLGHADGIQARSMEILATLGLEHDVVRHGRPFSELAIWTKTPPADGANAGTSGMVRNERKQIHWSPARFGQTNTIHQGKFERILHGDLEKYTSHGVEWNSRIVSAKLDESDPEYPVVVEIEKVPDAPDGDRQTATVRTKYLVGADGAHSIVRRSMNITMEGDATDEIWGVLDFIPETTFPDLRRTCLIMKDHTRTLAMVIPREKMSNGEWLTRIYIEMTAEEDHLKKGLVTGDDRRREVVQKKAEIRRDHILKRVADLFQPYEVKVRDGTSPIWWATYAAGQRLADKFFVEDSKGTPRVFLTGDACHTHSPRQGQGLNISIADAYYLSWRLAYVLLGLTPDPDQLLRTYGDERRAWAARVVNSDKRWNSGRLPIETMMDEMRQQVLGLGVQEAVGHLVSEKNEGVKLEGRDLLDGVMKTGRRLFNVQVKRYADGTPYDIHDDFVSDGRYRIFVLASQDFPRGRSRTAVEEICELTQRFIKGTVEAVFVMPELGQDVEWSDMPAELKRQAEMRLHVGPEAVYQTYGIDPTEGAIALLRPDGMISITTKLDDVASIEEMLKRVLKTR